MSITLLPETETETSGEPVDGELSPLEFDLMEDSAREAVKEPVSVRLAVAVAMPVTAAAVLVGGVFTGVAPRIVAVAAGVLGVVLAMAASRLERAWTTNLVTVLGVFAIGLAMIASAGFEHVFDVTSRLSEARADGDVLRPPVPFVPGWRAMVGWVMGMVAFAATWTAVVSRRPALGLLLPLPFAGLAAISVPDSQQVASGIAAMILFAIGLGVLSTAERDKDEQDGTSVAFEVRRAIRAIPLVALVTVALVALSQADFLFPAPLIDPTQEPQVPKTVPLSEVEDRVLFTRSACEATGPWRMGSLDVYTGVDWRLPPFADNQLRDVPETGIVDEELEPGVACTFEMRGLDGVVLPGLPNATGIRTTGPRLAYDARGGNIRVAEGQLETGLVYTVQAARTPSVNDLVELAWAVPAELAEFAEIPPPPAGVQALIDQAPTGSKWEQFDWLRIWVLDNVVAAGQGVPVPIAPERVDEIVNGTLEASPFEIVAMQAMLARWVGVPSRIGYGFDGGEPVEDQPELLDVRPRHGASFVEVWFPTYKWLPVIGSPKQAKASVDPSAEQNTSTAILPSEEIAVELYLPTVTPPASTFTRQVRNVVFVVVPLLLLLTLLYYTFPALQKAVRRSRLRSWAEQRGPAARIAVSYAEFRDTATDLGVGSHAATPLEFVDTFIDDEEHLQLAWLVTRVLWGDLAQNPTDEHSAHAEELARSLRRRLLLAQPVSMRVVATISRLSLRRPFAPELGPRVRRRRKEAARELVPSHA